MRLAHHMITWGDDFDGAIGDIADAGYHGFETWSHVIEQYDGREDAFGELMAQHGMAFTTVYGGEALIDPRESETEIADNVRWAAILSKIGTTVMPCGGGRKLPEGNTPEQYMQFFRMLNEIGKRTLDLGVSLAYHPHWGTLTERPWQLDAAMHETDPRYVFFAPDVAHMRKGGGDPVKQIRDYAGRVRYVHIKDIALADGSTPDLREVDLPERETTFVELGEGYVDLVGVVEALREGGFDGWVTVEMDRKRPHRTPKESAEISKRYALEKLGLTL